MFCEKCGYEIRYDAVFCENCGEPVNKSESEEILDFSDVEVVEITETQEIAETEKKAEEEEIKVSENITKSSTGSYNWMYEFSLWRNPAVLITVFKVLLIGLLVPALLMFFLTIGEGVMEALKLFASIIGIGAVLMIVLLIAGYVIISLAYGGKYYVLFKMDYKGVNHIQLDSQHKKAQALGYLTALIGVSTGNITVAGAGLLGASKKSLYTNFKKVKSIKIYNKRNTIYLSESLIKNQIYAKKEDFQFVRQFILENCPKNIKIFEK
jgi:hypothetical protein